MKFGTHNVVRLYCFKNHRWPLRFPSFAKWPPLKQNGGILTLPSVMYCLFAVVFIIV